MSLSPWSNVLIKIGGAKYLSKISRKYSRDYGLMLEQARYGADMGYIDRLHSLTFLSEFHNDYNLLLYSIINEENFSYISIHMVMSNINEYDLFYIALSTKTAINPTWESAGGVLGETYTHYMNHIANIMTPNIWLDFCIALLYLDRSFAIYPSKSYFNIHDLHKGDENFEYDDIEELDQNDIYRIHAKLCSDYIICLLGIMDNADNIAHMDPHAMCDILHLVVECDGDLLLQIPPELYNVCLIKLAMTSSLDVFSHLSYVFKYDKSIVAHLCDRILRELHPENKMFPEQILLAFRNFEYIDVATQCNITAHFSAGF